MKIALAGNTLSPCFTKPSDITYRNDIQTILSRVAKIGYKAIEMGTPTGFTNEEYKAAIDEAGIKVLTAGDIDYSQLLINDFSAKIKECTVLDAPNVIVSRISNLVLGNSDELKKFIRCLNKAGKIFRDEGLFLSYHNHAVEFTKINGKTIFEQIVQDTDPRYVFFEPNTHWIQAGGAHVITWLKLLRGRIFIARFADYAIDQYSDHTFLECTHRRFAEVGEGNLNWPGIIKECLEQNIEWCAVDQPAVQRPVYEAAALSYNNLKTFGV